MKIGIDLDGVIYDYLRYAKDCVLPLLKDVELKEECYNEVEFYNGASQEEINKAFSQNTEKYLREYFYDKKRLKEYVHRLHEQGHEIFVITARKDNILYWGEHPLSIQDRTRLVLHTLGIKEVFFSSKKSEMYKQLKLDAMIDDAPENFLELNEAGANVWLLDQPYNKEVGTKSRVKSVFEYFDMFLN